VIGNAVMLIDQEASVIGSGSNIISLPRVVKTHTLTLSNPLMWEVLAMPAPILLVYCPSIAGS
jgi:hypothetical protein